MLDGLELMRAAQAKLPPPEVSAADALQMHNDSAEENRKILDALSRLAPADGQGVDYDATIVRHVGGDMNSTNPLFVSSVTDFEYSDLTGFGLFGFDRELKFFASKDSVVSWQVSGDGLMDKVVLRGDLTWSDGKPITAYDVEFTYRLIMSDHDDLVIPAIRSGPDSLQQPDCENRINGNLV